MSLSNTATPIYYGMFRESVINGEIPVNQEVAMQMNLIDALIESPKFYYDDEAINGFVSFCEKEMTLTATRYPAITEYWKKNSFKTKKTVSSLKQVVSR